MISYQGFCVLGCDDDGRNGPLCWKCRQKRGTRARLCIRPFHALRSIRFEAILILSPVFKCRNAPLRPGKRTQTKLSSRKQTLDSLFIPSKIWYGNKFLVLSSKKKYWTIILFYPLLVVRNAPTFLACRVIMLISYKKWKGVAITTSLKLK